MPQDSETGESYKSDADALRAAGVEDAEAVLAKLEEDGYKLTPSESEAGLEAEEEMLEGELPLGEELELGGSPVDEEEEEALALSGGAIGAEEPLAKRRDKVAGDLMEQFKTGMV